METAPTKPIHAPDTLVNVILNCSKTSNDHITMQDTLTAKLIVHNLLEEVEHPNVVRNDNYSNITI